MWRRVSGTKKLGSAARRPCPSGFPLRKRLRAKDDGRLSAGPRTSRCATPFRTRAVLRAISSGSGCAPGGARSRNPYSVRYSARNRLFSRTLAAEREGQKSQMGVEGRDKAKALDAGAQVISGQLGKTVQRLRKAYNLSLSELSEQSGVAKSIISQIERNETNPTLATIWRLAQALDVSIERVLQAAEDEPFLEKSARADTPILVSDDGKCRLAIIGWIKTVEWLQWY